MYAPMTHENMLLCATIDDVPKIVEEINRFDTIRGFLYDGELCFFSSYGWTHCHAVEYLKYGGTESVDYSKRPKRVVHINIVQAFIVQKDGNVTFDEMLGTPIEKILDRADHVAVFNRIKKKLGYEGPVVEVEY